MKRKLGAETEGLLRGTTGEAVVTASGGRRAPALVREVGEQVRMRVINVKVTEDQYFAVQDEAVRRYRSRGGGGKPDNSEVVRSVLEDWLKRGGG